MIYFCSNEECHCEEMVTIGDSDFFEDPGGHLEDINTYAKDGKLICPYCNSEIISE